MSQATQPTRSKACISIQVCSSEIGLLISECEGRPREDGGRDRKEGSKAGGAERLWGDRVCGEDALTTSLSPCVWWAQPQAWGPWVLNSELEAHPAYPQGGSLGADNMSSILFSGPQVHCQPSLLWCPLRCWVTTLRSAHSSGEWERVAGKGQEESWGSQRHLIQQTTDYVNPKSPSGSFHR